MISCKIVLCILTLVILLVNNNVGCAPAADSASYSGAGSSASGGNGGQVQSDAYSGSYAYGGGDDGDDDYSGSCAGSSGSSNGGNVQTQSGAGSVARSGVEEPAIKSLGDDRIHLLNLLQSFTGNVDVFVNRIKTRTIRQVKISALVESPVLIIEPPVVEKLSDNVSRKGTKTTENDKGQDDIQVKIPETKMASTSKVPQSKETFANVLHKAITEPITNIPKVSEKSLNETTAIMKPQNVFSPSPLIEKNTQPIEKAQIQNLRNIMKRINLTDSNNFKQNKSQNLFHGIAKIILNYTQLNKIKNSSQHRVDYNTTGDLLNTRLQDQRILPRKRLINEQQQHIMDDWIKNINLKPKTPENPTLKLFTMFRQPLQNKSNSQLNIKSLFDNFGGNLPGKPSYQDAIATSTGNWLKYIMDIYSIIPKIGSAIIQTALKPIIDFDKQKR